jgi:DNA-binding transcriptional MocR family regulator
LISDQFVRYRGLVDDLAARITSGELAPGTRLPPLRELAYRGGIAYSTATRVYAELTRMGLVTGEVGRGTFVRAIGTQTAALTEPRPERVDLEYNFPVLSAQKAALADLIRHVPDIVDGVVSPSRVEGSDQLRHLAAGFSERGGWRADPGHVLFAGNGRQAIAAALAALVRPGDRVGVEPMTYPVVKGIAARLGVELVPVAADRHGLVPEQLRRIAASKGLGALYVQPNFHNPLGMLMPAKRRRDLAGAIAELNLPTIEDGIYAFLADERPLASWAPDHVILVDSLSKRVAPGMGLGYLVVPPRWSISIAQSLRSGAWGPTGLSLTLGRMWMSRDDARSFDLMKRHDAHARQEIARRALAKLEVHGDARAYHLWLALPEAWRADDFVAAASREGIAVTAAQAFAASHGHAPAAVRLALSAPPLPVLEQALMRLAHLAARGPVYNGD